MLNDILKQLEKTEWLDDIADAVMIVRLRNTHKTLMAELNHLYWKDNLNDVQLQDYADLSRDILAIQRILKLYGCEDE
jgi:hypothetical protein